jgi:hypothetical protein
MIIYLTHILNAMTENRIMKTYFKITVLIFLFFGVFFSSCKKYPEGPSISFRSAKDRVYGRYTLTKYTIDGADSLQQMKDRFGLNFHFFYNDYSEKDELAIDGPGISDIFISVFELIENNKDIWVSDGTIIFTGKGVSVCQDISFIILKLKNKSMHLKTLYNNKEYYLELNQTN